MILIQKGSSNNVVVTLTEKTTILNPTYLFEFKNDQSKASQYFISADISTQKERYNEFVVTEKASPNNLLGEVSLEITGDYTYAIREQASSTNLDPELSGDIVEVGKVRVIGTAETYYKYDGQSQTNAVYQA